MNSKSMAIMVLLAGGWIACGSSTGSKTVRDGAMDLGNGNGGTLGMGGAKGTGGSGTGGSLGGGGRTGTGGSSLASGGSTGNGGSSGGSGWDGGWDGGGAAMDGAGDTNPDAPLDAGPSVCQGRPGGACTAIVGGCAVCPSGSYASPTRAGCSEYSWCCTGEAPTPNDCGSANGVCVGLGSACPDGWAGIGTSCGSSDLKCCAPQAGACPVYPKQCAEIGGVCNLGLSVRCPPGTEPHALDEGYRLGCQGDNRYSWCCVPAPPSSCSDTAGHSMCFPGTECPGCYSPDENGRTCEAGRVCCYDSCD